MDKLLIAAALIFSGAFASLLANDLFLEAKNLQNKSGWVVDQQFMDLMGSSYLMAHGMGTRVTDAETTVEFPSTGEYTVFVRTFNWTSPWYGGAGPGEFQLLVNGEKTSQVLGAWGSEWLWQKAGRVKVDKKKVTIGLHDLTGFNGRVDAIYFTKGNTAPPNEIASLEKFRKKQWGYPGNPKRQESLIWWLWAEALPELQQPFQQPDSGCRWP